MPHDHRSAPVLLEVLAHMPADFFHCLHCERFFDAADIGAAVHREIRSGYPPEVLEEASRLAAWLQELSLEYGERLHIRTVDPQSPEGFVKSLRYWVRQYPTFIIDRKTKYTGWEPASLDHLLADSIADDESTRLSAPTFTSESIRSKVDRAVRAIGEFLYGMTIFEWVRDMQRKRGEVERLFVLVTFGDIVGVPILPPYYTLRLLPYIVPTINRWKRSLLRERDLTDLIR